MKPMVCEIGNGNLTLWADGVDFDIVNAVEAVEGVALCTKTSRKAKFYIEVDPRFEYGKVVLNILAAVEPLSRVIDTEL